MEQQKNDDENKVEYETLVSQDNGRKNFIYEILQFTIILLHNFSEEQKNSSPFFKRRNGPFQL